MERFAPRRVLPIPSVDWAPLSITPGARAVLHGVEAPLRHDAGNASNEASKGHRLRLGVRRDARPAPTGELGEGAPDRLSLKVRAMPSHDGPEMRCLERGRRAELP
eukprot:15165847-Alexandrium_andersonii.AAC.1